MPGIDESAGEAALVRTRQSLVERLKDLEDQRTWREFFALYWRLIYGVALKSGFTAVEAEDILQETIIAVAGSIGRFRTNPAYGSFRSWLLRITYRRMVDARRKRGSGLPEAREQEEGSSDAEAPSPSQEFEQLWDAEWNKALMAAALENLKRKVPPKQFQVYFLHAIKELSAVETGRIVGVNVAQVYLLKHRLGAVFKECVRQAQTQLEA